MLHYIWMFIVGIVVGIIAKLIYPGAAHMGIILTGILGIVGSFVGGFIALGNLDDLFYRIEIQSLQAFAHGRAAIWSAGLTAS